LALKAESLALRVKSLLTSLTEPFSALSSQMRQDVFLHSFRVSSVHSRTVATGHTSDFVSRIFVEIDGAVTFPYFLQ